MAWRSIWSKKGRSALTILSIFIGIAAVMTIVSVMEGMKAYTREQNAAMGSNKVNVYIYSWMYDENGNSMGKDYFPDLYDYCNSLAEYVDGVTPVGWCNATVSYGTKSSANMEYTWDEKGNLIRSEGPGWVLTRTYIGNNSYAETIVFQSDSVDNDMPILVGPIIFIHGQYTSIEYNTEVTLDQRWEPHVEGH